MLYSIVAIYSGDISIGYITIKHYSRVFGTQNISLSFLFDLLMEISSQIMFICICIFLLRNMPTYLNHPPLGDQILVRKNLFPICLLILIVLEIIHFRFFSFLRFGNVSHSFIYDSMIFKNLFR